MRFWEHIDPYTGNEVARGMYQETEDVDQLLALQKQTLIAWKQRSVASRIQILRPLIAHLENHKETWARKAVEYMGKPYAQALAEVEKCISLLDYYFEHSEAALQVQKTDIPGAQVQVEGLGIILGVMPWNFPYWQVFRYAIPALISGNVCSLKHAPNTFLCGDLIQEAFEGLAVPHLLHAIKIDHDQCAHFIKAQKFQGLSFTGSEKAGRILGALAGEALIPSVMELGGNNTFYVDEDTEIDKVVTEAITARLQNNGQSCIAAKRFMIHQTLFETFKNNLNEALNSIQMGDPQTKEIQLGPIARQDLAELLEAQVQRLVEDGAQIVRPFYRDKTQVYPCILEVKPEQQSFHDMELFGPVFVISAVENISSMVHFNNTSPYGLGAMLYTSKSKEALQEHLDSLAEGSVFINHFSKSHPALPFGGVKASGYGRELGIEGLFSFVNKKLIWLQE